MATRDYKFLSEALNRPQLELECIFNIHVKCKEAKNQPFLGLGRLKVKELCFILKYFRKHQDSKCLKVPLTKESIIKALIKYFKTTNALKSLKCDHCHLPAQVGQRTCVMHEGLRNPKAAKRKSSKSSKSGKPKGSKTKSKSVEEKSAPKVKVSRKRQREPHVESVLPELDPGFPASQLLIPSRKEQVYSQTYGKTKRNRTAPHAHADPSPGVLDLDFVQGWGIEPSPTPLWTPLHGVSPPPPDVGPSPFAFTADPDFLEFAQTTLEEFQADHELNSSISPMPNVRHVML